MKDGWGNDFFISSIPGEYTLASCGKGATGCTSISVTAGGGSGGRTGTFSDDIVFSNGAFVQWPEGKQQ